MKWIFKISKFLHKWVGLVLAAFLVWMSISGILLNHPELISNIDVAKILLPEQYHVENWSRSSLINLLSSKKQGNIKFIGGYQGVFISNDDGYNFKEFMQGEFPSSAYYRKTKSILLIEKNEKEYLLAGTYNGLYELELGKNYWKKINLPDNDLRIVKLLEYKNKLYVFSESDCFISDKNNYNFKLQKLEKADKEKYLTLLELFFELHNGELWGISGKLIWDAAGLVIIFLSIGAVYIWIFPGRKRKLRKKGISVSDNSKKIFKVFYKYHLKLGIWLALILFIIAFTGLFLRPPFIAAIMDGKVSSKMIPSILSDNLFHNRIRNAMIDKLNNRIVIDAKDGVWTSDSTNLFEFREAAIPVPIFAMGATVFESDTDGNLYIGSFAGLYKIDQKALILYDMINGGNNFSTNISRPSENLVTGYFKDEYDNEYISTHYLGLQQISGTENKMRYLMPQSSMDNYKLSLWNYLFEIHNARIFADWIGNFYILVIPLSSLMFLLIIISGTWDWIYKKLIKK